jgi:uncharacterized protein
MDEAKRTANPVKHGVDFAAVEGFDFENALVVTDERRNYEEARQIALGLIGTRLHVLVFAWRRSIVRVIQPRACG